jgi:hypothetical protein
VVPLFIALGNGGRHEMRCDDRSPSVQTGGGRMCDQAGRGPAELTIRPVPGNVAVAPPLEQGTAVQDVPADTSEVRLEVVSSSGGSADVEVLGPNGYYLPLHGAALPLARIATRAPAARGDLHVHATSRSDGSAIQCRIYAGTVLVALRTARSDVTCSVDW